MRDDRLELIRIVCHKAAKISPKDDLRFSLPLLYAKKIFMKNSVLFMAIPATLIAAFLFTNQPAQNSCANKSTKDACLKMCNGNYFAPDTLRLDPICNMKVDDKKGDTIHYKGHIFGFCSKYCRAEFVKDPEAYLPKKKN